MYVLLPITTVPVAARAHCLVLPAHTLLVPARRLGTAAELVCACEPRGAVSWTAPIDVALMAVWDLGRICARSLARLPAQSPGTFAFANNSHYSSWLSECEI